MNLFFFCIVLLPLSLTIAANLTQVYQWNEMDYVWPSEETRTKALKDRTFRPENIEPRYMAVYGTRIFISLHKNYGIPATLVTLPTSSASSAPPKLTPFPLLDMHGKDGCSKIQDAKGLQVDSVGRLWVLDSGSNNCNAKIWAINLSNNDDTKLIHRFSFFSYMHDLVLNEMPNETLAYIARWEEEHIVVFSLERKEHWFVYTPRMKVSSIALSPKSKEEPKQLYLTNSYSNELLSISAVALRKGIRIANPKLTGKWKARPYRILMDDHGTMYATFWEENYILSWNTSQPFQEQPFYEVGKLKTEWPFTFSSDSLGTFWMTDCELNKKAPKPRCRLLKSAVDVKQSYTSDSPTTVLDASTLPSTTVTPKCTCEEERQTEGSLHFLAALLFRNKITLNLNSALIGSLAFFLVLSCIINLWLSMRMRKLQNSNEQCNAGVVEMEMPTVPNPVSPEMVHEEVENDLYGVFPAPASRPRL